MNSYVMVGAGGTGSMLLRPLVTYLRAKHGEDFVLHVIDGDAVEAKNLERQQFEVGHITLNKAVALRESLADPHQLQAHGEYLSEDNIERYIQQGDVVLICADNFTVRKRIEERAQALDDVVVINGGNEKYDGSVQLYVRADGKDVTPRISYLHPEVRVGVGEDRAEMTCTQAAALPGGEQTIIANLTSATWMLTALWRYHDGRHVAYDSGPVAATWTEVQFDAIVGSVEHIDQRMSSYWNQS